MRLNVNQRHQLAAIVLTTDKTKHEDEFHRDWKVWRYQLLQ